MRGDKRRLRWLALATLGVGSSLVGANAPITEGRHQAAPLELVLADPGRSLRSAVEALGRGEGELADALLRAVAERHPIVADHADLLRMRLRVEAGRSEEAIGFESRWSSRESPLRGRFYGLLGDAYLASGDERRARAAWEFAAVASSDRERLAELELAIGESYRREGDLARATERLLEVWTRYAELDPAKVAETRLDELEGERKKTLRSADAYRKRGDQLYRRYHNESALAAYERALELGLEAKARSRAKHQRAETLFRLRRYPDAIRAYEGLPKTNGREIQRARAEARSGRVSEGARALEALGARRRGPDSVRATYLAALLWAGEKQNDRARKLFSEVMRRAPSSSYAGGSLWWMGWSAFRAGRHDEAAQHFARLARHESDPIAALRPRYWLIRVREERGDAEAPALYAALGREYPFTYYGWRALDRSGTRVEPRAAPRLSSGSRALAPADLARPRILLEAGLIAEARSELAALFRRARGVEDRLSLAGLYADAGDYSRAQRLIVDAYIEPLARGPAPSHIELWWHAWPAPYEDELRDATRGEGAPSAELVYSIMREESGYRPEVISVSGARGLLQLMPATATRVASSLRQGPFDPDDLFRPEVNIELGSAYLGQLLARFDGYASAAIGSYNAGPQAVSRWLRDELAPDDVWVEQIPYSQTRAYVKRVLRSLHVYRVLY